MKENDNTDLDDPCSVDEKQSVKIKEIIESPSKEIEISKIKGDLILLLK